MNDSHQLSHYKSNINSPGHINVYFRGNLVKLPIETITLLEGQGNYTCIYMRNGFKYLICKTLKSLSPLLGCKFIRVHKSFIVNPNYVVRVERRDRLIRMQCGNLAAINKRKINEIIEILVECQQGYV